MPTGPRPAILLSSLRRQGYDTASRLLSLDNTTANGHHEFTYIYDDVGNRMSMTRTDNSGTRGFEYTYDSIYQLTAVDYPESLSYLATDTTFAYDAAGNRTSVIDGSGTCTYTTNSLNQYTAAGSVSYQYDASGNLVHDQNYAYGYDPENRLVMVHRNGSLPPESLGQARMALPWVFRSCRAHKLSAGHEGESWHSLSGTKFLLRATGAVSCVSAFLGRYN